MMRKSCFLEGKLDRFGCKIMLKYFSDNLKSLEFMFNSKYVLKKFFFYFIIYGGFVVVDD